MFESQHVNILHTLSDYLSPNDIQFKLKQIKQKPAVKTSATMKTSVHNVCSSGRLNINLTAANLL